MNFHAFNHKCKFSFVFEIAIFYILFHQNSLNIYSCAVYQEFY